MKSQLDGFFNKIEKVSEVWAAAFEILQSKGIATAALDAEILLSHNLKIDKVELYRNQERQLTKVEKENFAKLIERRLLGEPIAQIVGKKEFWSMEFKVNQSCMIPRPETETLVEKALKIYSSLEFPKSKTYNILELGTGTGIIAISLAKEISKVSIIATDISLEALKLAKINAWRHGISEKIKFLAGDLFTPLKLGKAYFDLIIANPPYISQCELNSLSPEIVKYEPIQALYGGVDGLDFYRMIIPTAKDFLSDNGWIALEISYNKAESVCSIFEKSRAFEKISVDLDLAGIPRVVSAKKRGVS